jgi:hypothetical protein
MKIHAFRIGVIALAAFLAVTGGSSCSIPNLESPKCTAARDAVVRFYSFHFGNDMHPGAENLEARRRFLTDELYRSLSGSQEGQRDYFTDSDNYPKAFRVGSCKAGEDASATLQVLLLWKDDNASRQEEVKVETVEKGGTWLINKVSR